MAGRKNCRRVAKIAVEAYLKERVSTLLVPLYNVSVAADRAAFEAGAKKELFSSLYSYEQLLPAGASTVWTDKGILSVINPYCPGAREAAFSHAGRRPMPGPFDAAVDMGPDAFSEKLRRGECV